VPTFMSRISDLPNGEALDPAASLRSPLYGHHISGSVATCSSLPAMDIRPLRRVPLNLLSKQDYAGPFAIVKLGEV